MTLAYRNWLWSELVAALCEGNGPRWDGLAERCREAGVEYLLVHVREKWPVLAESFDRFNPGE